MSKIIMPEFYYRRGDSGPEQKIRWVGVEQAEPVKGSAGEMRCKMGGHAQAGEAWYLHHKDGRIIRVLSPKWSHENRDLQAIADGKQATWLQPARTHWMTGEKFPAQWVV